MSAAISSFGIRANTVLGNITHDNRKTPERVVGLREIVEDMIRMVKTAPVALSPALISSFEVTLRRLIHSITRGEVEVVPICVPAFKTIDGFKMLLKHVGETPHCGDCAIALQAQCKSLEAHTICFEGLTNDLRCMIGHAPEPFKTALSKAFDQTCICLEIDLREVIAEEYRALLRKIDWKLERDFPM